MSDNTANTSDMVINRAAPITLYRVSTDWMANLLSEIKREVIARAIEHECSSGFLDAINALELQLSEGAQFKLNYRGRTFPKGRHEDNDMIPEGDDIDLSALQGSDGPEVEDEIPEVESEPPAEAAKAKGETTTKK